MRAAPERESEGGNRCSRILILDPDPMVPEALAQALRGRVQIEWAPTGMAGVMCTARREGDLALVATRLPDMSSAEFLGLLRILRPCLPVAFLGTAPGDEPSGDCQPDVRFSKPLGLERVLAWIAERLGARVTCEPRPDPPELPREIPVQHLDVVRGVLEWIDRRPGEDAPLATLAREAGVSRWHLSRIFKGVTGVSVKRFLTRRRLQAARALLRESGVPVHQVACRVGYRDASHFARVFRQWEGQTPSRYRRQATLQARRIGAPPVKHSRFRTSNLPFDLRLSTPEANNVSTI